MKHNFSLALITCLLFLVASAVSKKNNNKAKNIPTIKDIVNEYHTQNTVNAIVDGKILRSQIDNNPSRYILLNGLPADKDPNVKRGKIKENDDNPYYPYTDPSKHPELFVNKNKQRYHSRIPVYQNDKKPYYGPADNFVVHNNAPKGTSVKVVMQDNLDKVKASVDNIITYQKQLDELNIQLSSGSNTYYDPTREDKKKKVAFLTKKIGEMKNELKREQALQIGKNNTVTEVTLKGQVKVENARNNDVESTNKSVSENFWYDVPRPANAKQRKITAAAARTNRVVNKDNVQAHHPDSQGLKTERVRIVSLRKLSQN